jgi:tRNA(Ile)-lysidine synthase
VTPDPALVARFKADLEKLTRGLPRRLGVAVSGGPDSLALLILAAAALPEVEAATVDHGLRPESASEAEQVADICRRLGVPHATLPVALSAQPAGNLQARARKRRYRALSNWAIQRDIPLLATAHHVNDQAETVLMRLLRGSGVAGLAGTRRSSLAATQPATGRSVRLVRPLLDWPREELASTVAAAGLSAVDDPANADERFDRTRIRALLRDNPWIAPERLAASAAHLLDAEDALEWMAGELFAERRRRQPNGAIELDAKGLPRELQRRLLIEAFACLKADDDLPGPKLARLLDGLRAGSGGTLNGVLATSGPLWTLRREPPRRS